MSETFICGHGRRVGDTPLPECVADVQGLSIPSGPERGETLRRLIDAPLCVPFSVVHEKVEALVGRPVWTHEFARPENLYREAATQEHPVDLEAHVIGSLDQLAGDKPVIIVRVDSAETPGPDA